MNARITCLCLITLILMAPGCQRRSTELVWNQSFYQIGSQSSPRTTDLNQDGILDIVFGAGEAEMADTDQGVIALDGATGELLWAHTANAQVVGSASFHDINNDSIQDVFIGGREHFLVAIDGSDGSTIWSYEYNFESHPILQYARYNFYNSTWVPDQTEDGHPEILIVNGGNWDAFPYDESDRWPGVLMLMDPSDGSIIAADTMPDGKESYMTPLYFEDGRGEARIIFGSGGETVSGHLYLARLEDLISQSLNSATVIASETGHGFIAPPSLVDLNRDGQLDLASISHAGRILAYDIHNDEMIWNQSFEGLESSNAFAIGNFNHDNTPDLLAVLDVGVWPQYNHAVISVINGQDGTIEFLDSLGCFAISSPVVYDMDSDGLDEAIFSTNKYDCDYTFSEDSLSPETIANQLLSIDFDRSSIRVIDEALGFKNLYSTPWIGDLDRDNYLDMVYSQFFNPKDIQRFLGMNCKRISTPIKIRKPVLWGAYMGSAGDGKYIN